MNYPILGHLLIDHQTNTVKSVPSDTEGAIPLVDVPMMSDYEWQKQALNDRLIHPEWYQDTEDVPTVIARSRVWLDAHTHTHTHTQ